MLVIGRARMTASMGTEQLRQKPTAPSVPQTLAAPEPYGAPTMRVLRMWRGYKRLCVIDDLCDILEKQSPRRQPRVRVHETVEMPTNAAD